MEFTIHTTLDGTAAMLSLEGWLDSLSAVQLQQGNRRLARRDLRSRIRLPKARIRLFCGIAMLCSCAKKAVGERKLFAHSRLGGRSERFADDGACREVANI